MNDIIIAYISPDIEAQKREKIAEMLRIHKIKITTIKEHATVVVLTPDQIFTPYLLLSDFAEKLVQQTTKEIVDLKNLMHQETSQKTQKPKHTKYNCALNKYNKTKQRQKQILFTRTNCK